MGAGRAAVWSPNAPTYYPNDGQAPDGWLGPYLAQSNLTLDLLKEAGYGYVMDWPFDDQPI